MLKIFGIKSKTRNICNWHDVENVDWLQKFLIILCVSKHNQKQYYSDINNFADNANIDGLYLKDIWQNVTNTDFLQETE